MKKTNLYSLLAIVAAMTLCACEKELVEETMGEPDCSLNIVTRTGEPEAEVSYPVTVYVFPHDGDKCTMVETIENEDDELELALENGAYDVFAIAGADDANYTLPTQSTATPTSEIMLKDGKEHNDLMTAKNTVILKAGEENNLTLSMTRQVLEISSVTIKQVPAEYTAVSVSLSPSYKSLKVNGSMGTLSDQKFELTKGDGGTWTLASAKKQLVASESTSITVSMTSGSVTKSYTYSCADKLRANYKFSITGTYTENKTVTLAGVITGVVWAGTREIKFTFNESGTQTDDTGGDTGGDDTGGGDETGSDDDVPTASTLYKDCFVLNVTEATLGHDVLLFYNDNISLSAEGKTEAQVLAEINTALSGLTVNGITGWRLPTADEADMIQKKSGSIGTVASVGVTNGKYYLLQDSKLYSTYFDSSASLELPYSGGQYLRPVTTVHFTK